MASTALKIITNKAGTSPAPINLEFPERLASVAIGSRLAISGLFKMFKHPIRSTLKIFAGGYLLQRGITGHCQLYANIGKETTEPVNVDINYTIAVNKKRQDVYDFWRKLENLPLFMSHLENIQVLDNKLTHWELKTPGKMTNLRWDATIVKDEKGKYIGWQSVPGSIIDNSGQVQFDDAPGGQGTIVKIAIKYMPPAGGLGTGIAKLLNPLFENMVREDVWRFKDYIENIEAEFVSTEKNEQYISNVENG